MIAFLQYSIRFSAVFLFGCVGEILTEKSGHLNLGIPGIMCSGAAGGCLGVSIYMGTLSNPDAPNYILLILCGLLMAFLFSAVVGAIYAFLTVTLKCNQNISGLALTTFGTGFTQFIIKNYVKQDNFSTASTFFAKTLPVSEKLGWFGELFFSYGLIFYFAIAIAVVIALVLNKSKAGLNLRAVGENPATADAVGINVSRYKYIAILIGSGIAGIGGFYFGMDVTQASGLSEITSTVEGYGWLAIALVIFTIWKPTLAIFGSIIFAVFSSLPYFINVSSNAQSALLNMVPYLITVFVLILTSIFGGKSVQPPASLGLNYFREER